MPTSQKVIEITANDKPLETVHTTLLALNSKIVGVNKPGPFLGKYYLFWDFAADPTPVESNNIISAINGITVASTPSSSAGTVVEIDFTATSSGSSFYFTDSSVTSSSVITVSQLGTAATGKDSDEAEFDALLLRAIPSTGGLTICAEAFPGPVYGKFNILYKVS